MVIYLFLMQAQDRCAAGRGRRARERRAVTAQARRALRQPVTRRGSDETESEQVLTRPEKREPH